MHGLKIAALVAVSAMALASAAWADDKPAYGPPAKWVSQMEGGKAVFLEAAQSVGRELPFDQADEANKVRRRLAEQPLIVRAPKGS